METVAPSGEMILISVSGHVHPTVETRSSTESSTLAMVMIGEHSVCPYMMVICEQCMSFTMRFITSMGHGAPAMTPVRRLVKSKRENSGCVSCAMNMVGT